MSTAQHTPSAGALKAARKWLPGAMKRGQDSVTITNLASTIDRETGAAELLAIALKILADHDKCLATEQPGFLTSTEECELRAAIAKAKGES